MNHERRLVAPRLEGKAEAASKPAPPSIPRPPLSRTYLVGRVHFVQNADQAHEMIQAAYENPISCIGIDTEYRFSSRSTRWATER